MTEYVERAFGECKKLEDPINRVGYLRRVVERGLKLVFYEIRL